MEKRIEIISLRVNICDGLKLMWEYFQISLYVWSIVYPIYIGTTMSNICNLKLTKADPLVYSIFSGNLKWYKETTSLKIPHFKHLT